MTEPKEAGELEVQPALFEHAQRVYQQMATEATFDKELNLYVYEGHLTQLFKKLLLSVPYYTSIKNKLAAMGCIEQTRRGGGNGTSRWVLWKEPTLEEWKVVDPKRSKHANKSMIQEQRIKDLTESNRYLQDRLDRLVETVTDLTVSVESLKERVS